MNQKTTLRQTDQIKHQWYLVDAENQILGRLASKVATILRGKDRADFAFHQDFGNYVCIINAEKIKVTGNKLEDKVYYRHTGYVGNLKSITLAKKLIKEPEDVILKAVSRMMPKNKLANEQIERLKIYKGSANPHHGQNPIKIELNK
jgi:large subunit ribosomal protein L13